MDKAGLANLSDTLFWVALVAYAASMALFFAALSGRRAVSLGRAALAIAGGGAIAHVVSVFARGFAAGRVPWGNMYEYSSVVGLLLVAGFLAVGVRRPALRGAGGFAMAIAVVTLATARGLYTPAAPLEPALNSWWLKVHVISAITASAIFSIGFVFTVLFLIKDRAERRAVFGGSTVGAAYAPVLDDAPGMPADHVDVNELPDRGPGGRGLVARLPKAATLDMLAYRSISIAFPIWTWAVIAGAIWASKAWSRYWGWDPKETWAFITWVVYAAYLHARATRGVRGRGAALIAVAGFVSLWITYYVVNLVISGLHSYAGV